MGRAEQEADGISEAGTGRMWTQDPGVSLRGAAGESVGYSSLSSQSCPSHPPVSGLRGVSVFCRSPCSFPNADNGIISLMLTGLFC